MSERSGSDAVEPEAQARRLLAWFPALLRATRGEEAVALVLDLLPPGADRLPWRARLDLVRAGLHARRLATPPFRVWYTVVTADDRGRGGVIPDIWRPWLADRLQRRAFTLWCLTLLMAPYLAFIGWIAAPSASDGGRFLPVFVASLLTFQASSWLVFGRRRWRRALEDRNGITGDGHLLPADSVEVAWTKPRLANLDLVHVAGLFAAVAAVNVVGWSLTDGVHPTHLIPAPAFLWVTTSAYVGLRLRHLALRPDRFVASVAPLTRPVFVAFAAIALSAQFLCSAIAQAGESSTASLVLLPIATAAGVLALVARLVGREEGRRMGLWDAWPGCGPKPLSTWIEFHPTSDAVAGPGPGSMVG